jgi:hypothetical protein
MRRAREEVDMRRFPWWLITAPALGFTECSEFSTVPVPPPGADTTAPFVTTRIDIGGAVTTWVNAQATVQSVDQTFQVFPVTMDAGGAKDFWVNESVRAVCRTRLGGNREVYAAPLEAQYTWQSGNVGSPVSDGMFVVGQVTSLAGYTHLCPPDEVLALIQYEWAGTARDFSGNLGNDHGSLTWEP